MPVVSRTDKTRPWWVQMASEPNAARPSHDHRHGECTLPEDITAATASGNPRRGRCYWAPGPSYWYRRTESHGYREYAAWRREERRRSRHAARRELRGTTQD